MDATPSEYIIMLGPGEKNGTALLAALWVEVSSARVVVGGSMGLVEGWHGMGVEEVIDLKRVTVVINEASGQPGVQCLLVRVRPGELRVLALDHVVHTSPHNGHRCCLILTLMDGHPMRISWCWPQKTYLCDLSALECL